MAMMLPPEPTVSTKVDGMTISRLEEIKYGQKFDWWLTMTDNVEQQLKQVYLI